MIRAVYVFLLGCLLLVVGAIFVFLATWALAAAGFPFAGEFAAICLSILLVSAFILAGSVIPGPPRPPSSLLVCPHCGVPSPVWIRTDALTTPDRAISDATSAEGRGVAAIGTR
jgi:hypothetical protein